MPKSRPIPPAMPGIDARGGDSMNRAVSRRRFIGISAATAGLLLLPIGHGAQAAAADLHVWRGVALGADACIQIHHRDAQVAEGILKACVAEVGRLERVFSLYRADSALAMLNRRGELRDPPGDLVRLMAEAVRFGRLTDGAFDVTVQPLWQLYAEHFARAGADPEGPPAGAIAVVRRLVDYRAIDVAEDRIAFRRAGMAVTLNGIAQGFITDRVVELLRERGVGNTLADLGEIRALGHHPDGTPWTAGLRDQDGEVVPLKDCALATSGAYGTPLDPAGRFGHLFDPATGRSADRWRSVSVLAEDATTADALSTALSVLPRADGERILAALPRTRVWFR
jgi:thiamine biosynthesis lipoprotein